MADAPAHSDTPVAIIGLGWLGEPLAALLADYGHPVFGTCTSETKRQRLNSGNTQVICWQYGDPSPVDFFASCRFAFINIPPGKSDAPYPDVIAATIAMLPPDCQLIFASSTGVYADVQRTVYESETDALLADHPVFMAENTLRQLAPQRHSIIRFAGLVGHDRFPGKYFSGKTNLPNGESPVNLIHRDDALRLIHQVMLQFEAGSIWHGCTPSHPTRMTYYSNQCQKLGLPAPDFIPEKKSWKCIDASFTQQKLGFSFQFPI